MADSPVLNAKPAPASRWGAAIFLGAFLLFQVQPMLAKAILPWFGGAPAVWTTCLLFFQTLLLGGYLYAHLLNSLLSPRRQVLAHGALLLASLAFLNILPSDYWRPAGHEQPVWRILALLAANIGAPYLLLSATSPLLQAWFRTAVPGASPYRLYALSNAGSLLALLSYPFLFEPLLTLKQQALLWGGLYALFALLCAWCARPLLARREAAAPVPAAAPAAAKTWGEWALWLLLPAAATALLMAVTGQLTRDVAAVPFLWVLPLALYLLSFILCFDGDRWYGRRNWLVYLVFACALAAYVPGQGVDLPMQLQVLAYCLALFIACMVCHGELAARRPPAERLTSFYLLVAAGGALGGALAGIAAPLALDGPWEYHFAWLAVASLVFYLISDGAGRMLATPRGAAAWALLLALYGGLAWALQADYKAQTLSRLVMARNFYGTLNIYESEFGGAPTLTLLHGNIEHGFQFAEGDPRRNSPVSYYAADTGVGVAVRALRRRAGDRGTLNAGLVGLGAGIMAAWGRAGDRFVFYEINPLMARLSGEYFTYLSGSPAGLDLVMGDARLSLEREAAAGAPPLDLLVLDAFSSDSIPMHLLTTEAFDTYFKRLRPGGVLAAHISNRYVDLEPLLRGLAAGAGKRAVLVTSYDDEAAGGSGSDWVLVTDDVSFLREPLVRKAATPWAEGRRPLVFSDQYSNLFRLLRRGWPDGWPGREPV